MQSSSVLAPSCRAGGEPGRKTSEFPLSIGKRKIVPFYLILRQVNPDGITFNEKLEGSFYD